MDINKEKLGPENRLFIGKTYLLPMVKDSVLPVKLKEAVLADSIPPPVADEVPEAKKVEYPIFGEKYASVPLEDKQLEGAVYYLVSGHGGPDPGAVVKHKGKTISEDEYAYDVTLRLGRKLISHGARVFLIIQDADDGIRDERLLELDTDEVNYPNKKIPRSQRLRLKLRTESVNRLFLANAGTYQRLIVTHVDSRSKGKNIDVFFYHHERSKKGKGLAENIHKTFKKKYARYQPNRTYSGTVSSRNSLYMVQNTLPATVYIELGNIRNEKDQRRILDPDNRQALAKWIGEGLMLDFTEDQK
ncbi:N-acetylmuramoyl-L-alanine amidase [Leptobacterium flavescens]|uniref:N-acetylmuramoyl-L-alanine amidase n=1 Tax=Leptobacterium flavescens TaxID=472055 RepID=A0A6P0ULX9_9FLAO|nr:N-acetylmuramoyl-L-alanine amidase [Leptobacterium flavescens]